MIGTGFTTSADTTVVSNRFAPEHALNADEALVLNASSKCASKVSPSSSNYCKASAFERGLQKEKTV